MAVRSADINVMVSAAVKAARAVARDFGEIENLQASRRGAAAFVAKSRDRAGRTLIDGLAHARPKFGLLVAGAAPVTAGEAGCRWLADPINGLANFGHGIPHFAVTIAVQRTARIVAGVVYDPLRDELYWAELGVGAYRNDQRLRVSGQRQPERMLVATARGGEAGGEEHARDSARIVAAHAAGIRELGCVALDLAFVAAGRLDGFWSVSARPWDCAAGALLVREAGGFVSALTGTGDPVAGGGVLAANSHLHAALGALVHARNPTPPVL